MKHFFRKSLCIQVSTLFFLVSSCSNRDDNSSSGANVNKEHKYTAFNIINGTIAAPSDFPSSVSALSGGNQCTWTRIGERHFIGAEHCTGQKFFYIDKRISSCYGLPEIHSEVQGTSVAIPANG